MFLIALGVKGLASYEHGARVENALPDLYRQMDPQGFVFAERQAASTRRVAPQHRKRLPADAYQNSSQSRNRGTNCPPCERIEGHRCRVFLDPAGKVDHRSTRSYVPLGKTVLQGGDCGRVLSKRIRRAISEIRRQFTAFVRGVGGESCTTPTIQ